MAKIKFNTVIKDMDGKPSKYARSTKEGEQPDLKDMTLAVVCRQALNNTRRQGEPITPDQMYKRGELISKIKDSDCDMSTDEIVIIKAAVAEGLWPPLVVFQAHQMLEGKIK